MPMKHGRAAPPEPTRLFRSDQLCSDVAVRFRLKLDLTEVVMEHVLHVLLVEDSPGDIRLTREAFHDANTNLELSVVTDGVEALAFLRREGDYAGAIRPELILLDLNMPRMDGREVLAHLKADDNLKTIPVVILTTSDSEGDIVKSYELSANCYLCKPVDLEQFEDLVKSINDFWLKRARLPVQEWAGGNSDDV
jgi:two-component system, chemotaxis family, response regulator Rcp1